MKRDETSVQDMEIRTQKMVRDLVNKGTPPRSLKEVQALFDKNVEVELERARQRVLDDAKDNAKSIVGWIWDELQPGGTYAKKTKASSKAQDTSLRLACEAFAKEAGVGTGRIVTAYDSHFEEDLDEDTYIEVREAMRKGKKFKSVREITTVYDAVSARLLKSRTELLQDAIKSNRDDVIQRVWKAVQSGQPL